VANLLNWLGAAADKVIPGNQQSWHPQLPNQAVNNKINQVGQQVQQAIRPVQQARIPGLGSYNVGNLYNDVVQKGMINPVIQGGQQLTNLSNATNPYSAYVRSQAKPVDVRSLISNAATTGLNAATFGEGGLLLQGGKALLPRIGQGIVEGGLLGGAQGAAGTFANSHATAMDYAKNIGLGAATGGALGAAVPVVGAGARLAATTTRDMVHAAPNILANQEGFIASKQAAGFGKAVQQGKTYLGPDNKPRFEVSDANAKIKEQGVKQLNQQGTSTLGQLLDHKDLYKQYPDHHLDGTIVKLDSSLPHEAQYNEHTGTIHINPDKVTSTAQLKQTVLHETQHVIQGVENTARGGLPGPTDAAMVGKSPDLQAVEKQLAVATHARDAENLQYKQLRDSIMSSKSSPASKAKQLQAAAERFTGTKASRDHQYLTSRRQELIDAARQDPTRQAEASRYRNLTGEAEANAVEQRSGLNQRQADRNPVDPFYNRDPRTLINSDRAGIAAKAADDAKEVTAGLAKQYAEHLRSLDKENGGVQLLKNADGSYQRASTNSPFYRKYYKEHGKPPTKDAYLEEAHRQLAKGKSPEALAYQQASDPKVIRSLEADTKPKKLPATTKPSPTAKVDKLAKTPEKPIGEQIGRLKAQINKEADPNTKAELTKQLKPLQRQYAASKGTTDPNAIADALGIPKDQRKPTNTVDRTKPTQVKVAEDAKKQDQVTAKAIEQQRKAPAPIKLPEVQAGDTKQAVLNSRAVPSLIMERAKPAVEAARNLSAHDHDLLDQLTTTSPEKLAKQANDPKAFMDAANKAKAFNDYTHAIGTGSGQAINYREHYGASQLYDMKDPETAAKLEQYQAKLKEKPGYSKERLIPDYKTGAKLGLKRLNKNFAADLEFDAARRGRDISELTLAKGLKQAYPGQVAVGEIPRGYKALQIAHGSAISMPTEIADKLNKRGAAPAVNSPVLKGYDAVNRGLKYTSLGGGTFHALTTAGSTMGQQLLSGKLITRPIDSLKIIGGTLSHRAHDANMRVFGSNVASHSDSLSTHDRALLSGVTLKPAEILGDANIRIMDKVDATHLNFIKAVHDMVFDRQIPEAKLTIFEQATKGLGSNKPADLAKMRQVASAVNNLGGINRAIEGITPRDAQVAARAVLATDFTETKFRKLADALTSKGPDGTIARQMVVGKVIVMALPGLVAAAAAGKLATPADWGAEAAKQVLDPQVGTSINDPKTGNNKVAKLPGTEVAELGRILMPLFADPKNRLSGAQHYVEARTSAGLSTLWSLVSNKDYFGAPVIANDSSGGVDVAKTAGNLATSKAPIPISQGIKVAQGKEGLGEAALNTAGLRVTADKSNPSANTAADLPTSNLVDAKGTPEAKAIAKQKKLDNARALEDGSRLGGTTTLDAAQTRIDNAKKNLNTGINQTYQDTLVRYAKLNDNGRKVFDSDPNNTYNLHVAQYVNDKANGKLDALQDYKAQQSLAKENVTRKYGTDVQAFYSMSKAQQAAFVAANPGEGQQLYQQAQKLASDEHSTKYKYGLGTKPKGLKLPSMKSLKTVTASRLTVPKVASRSVKKIAKLPTAKLPKVKVPKATKRYV
jgi:hypothetical protein